MKPKSGKSITFLTQNKVVYASQIEGTVLSIALKAGIKIEHSCGGNGTCGTCLVNVREGLDSLGPRNEIEAELAEARGLKLAERLCCQMESQDGLVLEIPGFIF